MKYKVTLLTSRGVEMPVPSNLRDTQNSLGLAIATAHKILDALNGTDRSAVIRQIEYGKGAGTVVKVITQDDRMTRSPNTPSTMV